MQIWCDASFNQKTKDAGLGILLRQMVPDGIKETRITLKKKAQDNNEAEMLAIYYALQNIKGVPKEEPLFLITDSKVAIDFIKNPRGKYYEIASRIRGMLWGEKWKIYHCRGHQGDLNKYTKRQCLTDYLAKTYL